MLWEELLFGPWGKKALFPESVTNICANDFNREKPLGKKKTKKKNQQIQNCCLFLTVYTVTFINTPEGHCYSSMITKMCLFRLDSLTHNSSRSYGSRVSCLDVKMLKKSILQFVLFIFFHLLLDFNHFIFCIYHLGNKLGSMSLLLVISSVCIVHWSLPVSLCVVWGRPMGQKPLVE